MGVSPTGRAAVWPLRLAIATAVWTLGLIVIGGAFYPGYDHAGQFISELGAVDAPTYPWAGWLGLIPIGILQCLFCLTAARSAPKSGLALAGFIALAGYGVGAIGGGVFPCDAGSGCMPDEPSVSQLLHNAIGGGGYLAGVLGLVLVAIAALGWQGARWLGVLGLAAAATAFTALFAIEAWLEGRGALQRAAEAAFLVWFLACGWWLSRRP